MTNLTWDEIQDTSGSQLITMYSAEIELVSGGEMTWEEAFSYAKKALGVTCEAFSDYKKYKKVESYAKALKKLPVR